MSKILIIYTGGTIGMVRNPRTGALEPCTAANLTAAVPEISRFGAEIETANFERAIDSSDMMPSHWALLVDIIEANYSRYSGFVILHGTDTMAFTASALSFMLRGLSKPVILTGSQLPLGAIRTDAKENLITAIEIAAATDPSGAPLVSEVCIYFHDQLLRGNRASKASANSLTAFVSSNYPVLADTGTDIAYHREFLRRPTPREAFEPWRKMDSGIVILSLFPGLQREAVAPVLESDRVSGIIFRTFGSGNAPHNGWLVDSLRSAVAAGKTIVNITQCATGSVEMERYETGRQLLDAGVVSGHDSTVEAALTKLMYLMGRRLPQSEIRRLMNTDLRGEVTL